MINCQTILVTSCKGGVGKSTIVANLAYTLAAMGKKTLAMDCDFFNRSLDLIFGYEDKAIYDLLDAVEGGVHIRDIVISDHRTENLYICTAPYRLEPGKKIDHGQFRRVINEAIESLGLEYIIIDTPGSDGTPIRLAGSVANTAIIIASHQPTSIRAAEKTGMVLDEIGVREQRLLINSFDTKSVISGDRPGIIDIIDKTRTRVIGVVPYDRELLTAQEKGKLAFESKSKSTTLAFRNISKRILGESVPLMKGVKRRARRSLMYI